MAQPSTRLGYVCRNCQFALRHENRGSIARSQIRNFSNTRQQNKSLATFNPTSNPELDGVLNNFREKVFLPSILSAHHQSLVTKTKHRDILLNAPGVTATVLTSIPPHANRSKFQEEETIRLTPLGLSDLPNRRVALQIIAKALEADSSADTWDNLIPFLDGLRQAKIPLSPEWMETLARKANKQEEGRWNTLLEAAVQGKRTQFTLSMIGPTRELVYGALHRAVKSGFEDTKSASLLEKIAFLMEKKEHCTGSFQNESATENTQKKDDQLADMRQYPSILATKLALTSAAVLRDNAGKDTDGKVVDDMARLLAANAATSNGLVEYIETLSTKTGGSGKRSYAQQSALQDYVALYAGLALANKVDLKPALSKEKHIKFSVELQKLLQKVKPRIATLKEIVTSFEAQRTESSGTRKPARALVFLADTEQALQKI